MRQQTIDRMIRTLGKSAYISVCLLIFFAGFSNSGVEICFFIAFFASLAKDSLEGKLRSFIPDTPLNLPMLVFFLAGLGSLTCSIYPFESLHVLFTKIAEYIMICLLVVKVADDRKKLDLMVTVILFTAALLAASGIYQRITGYDFLRHRPINISGFTHVPRLTSAFIKRTGFGAYLSLVIPLGLSIAVSGRFDRKFHRILLMAITALLTYCLIYTYARGAWIGTFVGFCLFAIYLAFRFLKFGHGVIAVLLMTFASLTIFPLLPDSVQERIVSTQGQDERISMWRATANMVKNRPFLGHGVGRFIDVYPSYRITGKHRTYAHNSYLQIAAEMGLVGLAAFLWMVSALLFTGMRALFKRHDSYILGLLCGMAAFLTHSLFDNNLFSLQLVTLFWTMVGMAIVAIKMGDAPQGDCWEKCSRRH